MATFHPSRVCASQENVLGGASDKKEVQEQACYGLCGFLPMLTAQRKKSHAPRWGRKEGHPHGSPQHQQLFGASETCKFKEEYR